MLNKISSLTVLLRKTVGGYSRETEKFLSDLQDFTAMHRLYLSSDIAVELQKLISFAGKNYTTHVTAKERDSFAAKCMENVQIKAKEYLNRYEGVYSECENICRQIAAQVAVYNAGAQVTSGMVIAALKSTESLKPYYVKLVGDVGIFNHIAIIDAILPQTLS